MTNTVENRVIELPDNSKSIENLRKRITKYARIIEILYPQNKESLKKSNLYMSLIIQSELLLNKKLDFDKLYQELEDEEIINTKDDFIRYENCCDLMKFLYI